MKLKPYKKTKSSGVEWLGDVPEHWSVKAIKWESPVLRGASPRPIDDPIYFDDDEGEYAWVRISDVTAAGMFLTATEQKLSRLGSSLSVKLEPGALFLSIAGSVGKPCITKIKCCIHDGFVYFPRFKGNSKFLYYLFASGEPYRGLGKLGTQLNLNTDTVGSISVGFPDPTEQRAIAAFLDRETGRMDALVAKKRELIERLKEKRTALISRTVTRGLPAAAAAQASLPVNPPLKPSGLDWLGEIPKHWEEMTIKRVALSMICGPFGSSLTKDKYTESGYRVYGQEQVIPGDFSIGDYYISADYFSEMKRYEVRAGDVLVSCVGTFGKAAVVPDGIEPGIINPRLILIRPDRRRIDPEYMGILIRSHFAHEQLQATSRGGTMDIINLELMGDLVIPLPPLPEQTAIAAYLDAETAKLDKLVGKVEAAVERLQEYRTALITAAVTGKIDVRSFSSKSESRSS